MIFFIVKKDADKLTSWHKPLTHFSELQLIAIEKEHTAKVARQSE